MTTKDIRTSHAHTVCDICGRTLLRGERAEIYINGGARRSVCELCRPRALHEGWVREGTLPDYSQSGSGSERRRSLLNRLRGRRGTRRTQGRPSLDDELAGYDPPDETVRRRPSAGPRSHEELTDERWDDAVSPRGSDPAGSPYRPTETPEPHRGDPPEEVWDEGYGYDGGSEEDFLDEGPRFYEDPGDELPPEPEPRGRRPWSRPPRSLRNPPGSDRSAREVRNPRRARNADQSDLAGARMEGREPRHVRAVPAGEVQKMAAAVDLFNQSEHRRTVAGVARSLGGAGVAVLPAADPPSLVQIVVWWELCWYRYTVDLSDAVPGVRVDGQGYELSELTEAERTANAAADESGQLILR